MQNIVRQDATLPRHHRETSLTDRADTTRVAIKLAMSVSSVFGIIYAGKTLLHAIKPQDAITGAVVIGVLIGKIVMELLNTRRNETDNELIPLVNRPLAGQEPDIHHALQAAYRTIPTGAAAA